MHCNAREGRAASRRALICLSSDHYGTRPRPDVAAARLRLRKPDDLTRQIAESTAFGGRRCPRVERGGQRGEGRSGCAGDGDVVGCERVNFRSMPSVSDVQRTGNLTLRFLHGTRPMVRARLGDP
jgi:hypothetical protein